MPQTDPDAPPRSNEYWRHTSIGFSTKLANSFDLVLDAVDAADAEAALAVLALHGQGREPGEGMNLQVNAGLAVKVTDGRAWILGRPVVLSTEDGFDLVVLPANDETWVYVDDDLEFHTSEALIPLEEREVDWVCLGSATTDASECIAVDMTDADVIQSIADLQVTVDAMSEVVSLCRTAIGEAYFGETPPEKSLDERIDEIVAGAVSTIYASLLTWSSTDPRLLGTVINDVVAAAIAAHVAALHSGGGEGGGGGAIVVGGYYDWSVINLGRMVLHACEFGVMPDLPEDLLACVVIVWGVYGDGSNGTPNNVHPDSTWVPVGWPW
jgi:hypothetical protein